MSQRIYNLRFIAALIAALLAASGLARAGHLPHAPAQAAAPVLALGAALCHSDGPAPVDQPPADQGLCQHCPSCGALSFALAVPPPLPAVPMAVASVPRSGRRLDDGPRTAARDTARGPRAPPGLA